MPELIKKWTYTKNVTHKERLKINKGCGWIVRVWLKGLKELDKY